MRWMVTGSAGMLGTDAVQILGQHGETVFAHTRATVDLADPDAVRAAVQGVDVVLHCAAWTAVDDAEANEVAAYQVNAELPAVVAEAAAAAGARTVLISTDYVFGGDAVEPYAENAATAPRSAYGRTKATGERAVRAADPRHLIVRTAWLYGQYGNCFPKTIVRVAAERGGVSVVDDQIGQPTWTVDVVELIRRLVAADAPAGTYHATSSGQTSWFGFARAAVASAGMDPQIVTPTDSASFQRPAPRPAYSVLGHQRLLEIGVSPIGDWEERWGVASAVVL